MFIISNMETGGVSKSMASLMNVFDRRRYDVSLMITSPKGAFMELLPRDLRTITNPVWSALYSFRGVGYLLKKGHLILALGSMLRLMLSALGCKVAAARLIARMMPAIDEEFDTIVDYNGQQQLYYMVDKLKSRKKVTFFHSDYAKWPYYYKTDKKYFGKVDRIFTISDVCVDSLCKFFPEHLHKIGKMENILSLDIIDRLADEAVEDMKDGKYKLLTVGHVCENKGFLWAVEAASILKRRGVDFHWYFLGSVSKPEGYKSLIEKSGVSDCITLLGIRTNPYAYMSRADVIVHPSKFEGKSIALDEAKLLCKPVVVTNFTTVGDQFTDGVNASICEMSPESIANAVEKLLNDKRLQEKYKANLKDERSDNSSEVEKLYTIIDD